MELPMCCEWSKDCKGVVSHLDEKGFIYCASHGNVRKAAMRCRKLTPREKRTLQSGGTIQSY